MSKAPRLPIVYLHLKDEVPAFGCGVRRIEVKSIGPKWVHAREVWSGGDFTHVPRVLWDRIKQVPR